MLISSYRGINSSSFLKRIDFSAFNFLFFSFPEGKAKDGFFS